MDCKELMVGDIVGMKNDDNSFCFIKVGEIEKSRIWGYFPREISMDGILYEDLHPIPLTLEILKANGIYLNDDINEYGVHYRVMHSFYADIQQPCRVYDINNDSRCTFTSNNIKYVHELQHAMRICGFIELADNFNVKEYAE